MTAAAMVFLIASWAIAFGALVPSLYFFIQVLSARQGAARARAPHAADDAPQVRLAVLIPAHNEAAVIASTVRDLRDQIGPHDRLLVVADNCVDETAELARAAGAEAAERFDASRRGKGFALAYGVQVLAAAGDPPDIVVMVDADCRLLPGTVRRLANAVVAWGAPVQASFLVLPPDPVSTADRAAAFA